MQGIYHSQTGRQLSLYLKRPAHAILLLGVEGGGKLFTAQQLSQELLGVQSHDELYKQAYFKHITAPADKNSIGIEAVRDLQQFTKLRLPGADSKRVIVVCDAHLLTVEAQNAILKMLEEPSVNTYFILTAASGQALLPTIRSRAQQINVLQPPQPELTGYFETQGLETKAAQQAYMMGGGLPGLMSALLHNEDHPLKASVQTARKLLQSSQFERLCLVDGLSKDKPETLQVLFVLQHMARAAIAQSAKAGGQEAAKRIRQWHKVMQAAYDAERSYAVSGQAKLTLTNLMLAM